MRRRVISCLLLSCLAVSLSSICVVIPGCAGKPDAGKNLLAGASWQYSTDGGQTWRSQGPVVHGGEVLAVQARTSFDVDSAEGFVALELTHGAPPYQRQKYYLNDARIGVPLKGMYYKTIPAIPPDLLRPGRNELKGRFVLDNRPPPKERAEDMRDVVLNLSRKLLALEPRHLVIHSGPVLGAFGEDYFSVTCRTNMHVPVTLTVIPDDGGAQQAEYRSPPGRVHRFRAERPASSGRFRYHLQAACGETTVATDTYTVRLPSFAGNARKDNELRLVIMGDSRTFWRDWQAVAGAVLKQKPELVVFGGDMVSRGRSEWQWEREYLAPARELLATVPYYPVIGNHEEKAPLYPLLFFTPGRDGLALNWSQQIGEVLLIGIEGRDDWSPESDNVRWLEGILSEARAKFVFLTSHYPAWTSGKHGALDPDTGEPKEYAVFAGQKVIVPLLEKYKATAMFAGHDHMYERSELPSGLTHVITGAAGAPLRGPTRHAARQNPYSRICRGVLHYCLLDVKGDTCTMTAITLDGEVLDTRTWKARQPK